MEQIKNRIPWVFQLLYDFPYAMDLVDEAGNPDHDKMLPALAAIAFIIFIFVHPQPSWEAMVAWIVAGGYIYGFSAWRLVADRVMAQRGINNALEAKLRSDSETPPDAPSQGD